MFSLEHFLWVYSAGLAACGPLIQFGQLCLAGATRPPVINTKNVEQLEEPLRPIRGQRLSANVLLEKLLTCQQGAPVAPLILASDWSQSSAFRAHQQIHTIFARKCAGHSIMDR